MTEALRVGLSTCPNDTFAFAALLEGRVQGPALSFELLDIEALNEGLAAGRFDVAKASFAAALSAPEPWTLLPVGAALGFGVGPVLVAASGALAGRAPGPDDRILCPGRWTTATLLFRLFHRGAGRIRHVVFSEIGPRLLAGEAEYGVLIHEGRFTFAERGLFLAEDLGARWERRTGRALPLGGLFARPGVSQGRLRAFVAALRTSLDLALAEPESALPAMRAHAREQEDRVLWRHVELYVNENTRELGARGAAAVAEFARLACAEGLALRASLPLLEP